MTQRRWIPNAPEYEQLHDKIIIAQCSFPNGLTCSGSGKIWYHKSVDDSKCEVCVIIEDHSDFPVIYQYRLFLSHQQVQAITPCERADCDYIYEGTLIPE
jgi:hypothetical protein